MVPLFVMKLFVLSFQHVDTGNSYLCGYLKIKGLTEVSTHLNELELKRGLTAYSAVLDCEGQVVLTL